MLLKRKLVEEVPAGAQGPAWREIGEDRFGLAITPAGRAAIAVEDAGATETAVPATKLPVATTASPPRPSSKSSKVVGLLQRNQGATLAELVEATGWLPHTTRAALTGLRKKGHAIDKFKRDDVTCYRIAAVA